MSDVTISVIIPTIGRASLGAAEASAAGADQVIVIENRDGDHGYSARERGAAIATGTHLAFLDDDDVYTEGAIQRMRDAACKRPVIFRMDHHRHGIMWRKKQLEFGNVGTPMFLVPNDPNKLGRWYPHQPELREPGGDFSFISGCVEAMGEPVWREEVTCMVRPNIVRSIAIVTAWRNNPGLSADYMQAVRMRGRRDWVIVVDDASNPPLPFSNIRLDEPRGFAACNNAGLDAAKTDAVLFLNSDIVARSPDWLEPIRELLQPGVFVGAQLRYDPHGRVDGEPMPYIDGWCLAGMTDDLRSIGGWDEELIEHGYYADNDISFRARLAGITLKEARVPITHLRDTKQAIMPNPHIQKVTLRNKAIFEDKVRDALGASA